MEDLYLVKKLKCDNDFSPINESHVDSVEISKPVILAEIFPGQYNLIDGNML